MFNIGISRDSQLLLVCTGDPVFADFCLLIELAASAAAREGWKRLLIDCTSLAPTFSSVELAMLGLQAGRSLAKVHVALVIADVTRFDVTRSAALSVGLSMQLFADLAAASAWLDSLSEMR